MIISKGFMLPKIKLLTLKHSEIVDEKLLWKNNVTPETVKFIS